MNLNAQVEEACMNRLLTIAGMLVVLALAFGLDIAFIQAENLRTSDIGPWRLIALFDIAELGFAIPIMAFGWLFLFKSAKSATVSSIVLIVGLLLFFSWPLWMLLDLAIESLLGPFGRFAIALPLTYLFHTGALFALRGTAGLLRTIARFRAGTHAQVPSNS
jgi:hypothetical protein